MNIFREKFRSVDCGPKKWPITHILSIIKFSLKRVTFTQFLMPVIRCTFRKTWTDLEKSSKAFILDPKMTHFSYFGVDRNFP